MTNEYKWCLRDLLNNLMYSAKMHLGAIEDAPENMSSVHADRANTCMQEAQEYAGILKANSGDSTYRCIGNFVPVEFKEDSKVPIEIRTAFLTLQEDCKDLAIESLSDVCTRNLGSKDPSIVVAKIATLRSKEALYQEMKKNEGLEREALLEQEQKRAIEECVKLNLPPFLTRQMTEEKWSLEQIAVSKADFLKDGPMVPIARVRDLRSVSDPVEQTENTKGQINAPEIPKQEDDLFAKVPEGIANYARTTYVNNPDLQIKFLRNYLKNQPKK